MDKGERPDGAGQQDPLAKLPTGWLRQQDYETSGGSTRWLKFGAIALVAVAAVLAAVETLNWVG